MVFQAELKLGVTGHVQCWKGEIGRQSKNQIIIMSL